MRVTWRVPRDQPVSDSYVLTARTVPAGLAEAQARGRARGRGGAGGELTPPAAQINSLKVVRPRARLEVARVGHAEVEVRGRGLTPGAYATLNATRRCAPRRFAGLPAPCLLSRTQTPRGASAWTWRRC